VQRLALSALIFLALTFAAAGRAAADNLYQVTVFVTGEGEANRAHGFAQALAEVLVKVSGDQRLRADPRVAPLKAEAARFVAGFSYRDRMAGIPVHDEQGTRERPFDLTITFDHGKINAALKSLGRAPWPEPRPALAVLLWVHDVKSAYVLAADGEGGYGERLSLAAAAAQGGIATRLPLERLVAARHLTEASIAEMPPPQQDAFIRAVGGNALLRGTLVWSEVARGWEARWRLVWHGHAHRWRIGGVSFDDAFRNAIARVAAVLSDHGG
jgi:uncharacterized protein